MSYFSSSPVCSDVPVEILPRIRIEGTRMPILESAKLLMILGTTPLSITQVILSLLASEW